MFLHTNLFCITAQDREIRKSLKEEKLIDKTKRTGVIDGSNSITPSTQGMLTSRWSEAACDPPLVLRRAGPRTGSSGRLGVAAGEHSALPEAGRIAYLVGRLSSGSWTLKTVALSAPSSREPSFLHRSTSKQRSHTSQKISLLQRLENTNAKNRRVCSL